MHMALTRFGTAIMYDRADYGPSGVKLPEGRCRSDPRELALKEDCYAHSVELELATCTVRPLEVWTDTWCSSAAFLPDGTLMSTGGWNDGSNAVRVFTPCGGRGDGRRRCDWSELPVPQRLGRPRWYASDQILPDGRVIVVGGRKSFSYEFVPKMGSSAADNDIVYSLPFLYQTNEPSAENNLYPFLHLSTDGSLFVFANSKSILLDYRANRVLRAFPDLPGGSRNYPSSGSSAMLPLEPEPESESGGGSPSYGRAEVMICGGSPHGAWQLVTSNKSFAPALPTCGRIVITDPSPRWSIESMPEGRVMGDMIVLPTSEILIVNGASKGTAGWGCALDPSLSPFLYTPSAAPGSRFRILAASPIPRMYHSSAVLVPDGRVLVGGSNTNPGYAFSDVPFPTELRIEAFSPPYLDPGLDSLRPSIAFLPADIVYGQSFDVGFAVPRAAAASSAAFKLYAPSFSTHSTQMNQRQLVLQASSVADCDPPTSSCSNASASPPAPRSSTTTIAKKASLKAPPSPTIAPPGYYLFYIVVNGSVPSLGSWVRISSPP
jgi:hypothetical protein